MPTVVVVRGFRVRVHFNEDGDPPHVHVFKGGREYRVHLLDDGAALLTAGGRETVPPRRRVSPWRSSRRI